MSQTSSAYVYDSENECDRLERQAGLLDMTRLLRTVQPASGARILDAGCGSGATARQIARRHPDAAVTGVDRNADYVDYARRRAAADGLENLTFEAADIQALPFADRSFDLIWSQFVLYFLPSGLIDVDDSHGGLELRVWAHEGRR